MGGGAAGVITAGPVQGPTSVVWEAQYVSFHCTKILFTFVLSLVTQSSVLNLTFLHLLLSSYCARFTLLMYDFFFHL